MLRRLEGAVLLVPVVSPYELVAMHAVERQDDHDGEVRHQEQRIEGVPSVEAFERLIGIVRPEIVVQTPLRGEVQRQKMCLVEPHSSPRSRAIV